LNAAADLSITRSSSLIALDEALSALAEIDPRKARIVSFASSAALR
jgi:hypothetical protein